MKQSHVFMFLVFVSVLVTYIFAPTSEPKFVGAKLVTWSFQQEILIFLKCPTFRPFSNGKLKINSAKIIVSPRLTFATDFLHKAAKLVD